MDNKNYTILDLSRYVKVARELAILGNYEKSLSKYKTALNIIQARLGEISENYLKDKWKGTEDTLKNEVMLVYKAYEIAKRFENSEEERRRRQREEEEENNKILMRDYKPDKKKEDENGEYYIDEKGEKFYKRWAHFGGRPPFGYVNDPNDPNNVRHKPKKDPDVWDPPDDYKKPAKKVAKPSSNYNKPSYNKPSSNYNRPGMQANNNRGGYNNNNNNNNYNNRKNPSYQNNKNQPSQPGKQSSGKDGEKEKDPREGKSAFYLDRYPEGNGPDGELIEMIEREVVETNPNIRFDDIAELDAAKATLKEAVLLPLLMPDFFRGIRRPWKGVLLYGPPGTGKTLLAKALATQGKTTFFNVSATTFASKWKGESEKLVRILFEMARFYAPSTIFIDEVDSIGTKRGDGDSEASRKVLAEMLVQMDGVSGMSENEDISNEELKKQIVMVLAATNHPWDLDDALRRRFEKRVYIPLPNSVGRREMFKINMKGVKLDDKIDMDELIKLTDGYSGADISIVCREAALMPMRMQLDGTMVRDNILKYGKLPEHLQEKLEIPISQDDIKKAIKNISKSVSDKDLKKYEEWTSQFANN